MPDPKFHKKSSPLKISEIISLVGAQLHVRANPDFLVEDIGPLDQAQKNHLTFLDNPKYKHQLVNTKAGACLVHKDFVSFAPSTTNLIICDYPYRAYAQVAQKFYPEILPDLLISKNAIIDPTASIGKDTLIHGGAVIGANVTIGDNCVIGANAVISHALIGNNVRIYPGACIGQDGFGFAPAPTGYIKIPQLGRVIIGNNVEIGANCTIDRGSGPDTVVGEGTWIDNLVQVAHNVKIGKGCIIAAQTGISGSTTIEDFVSIGGQVGISGHLTVGKGARIAAKSGVTSNVPAGAEYMGYPARPMRQYLKSIAHLNRLIKS